MRRRRSSYWVSMGPSCAPSTGPRVRARTDGTASALGDERAGGDLRAVGEGTDPEVVEHVARDPLQLPQAGDGQLADLDVGVLAGPHGDEVPPGAVVAGDDDARLGGVGTSV